MKTVGFVCTLASILAGCGEAPRSKDFYHQNAQERHARLARCVAQMDQSTDCRNVRAAEAEALDMARATGARQR